MVGLFCPHMHAYMLYDARCAMYAVRRMQSEKHATCGGEMQWWGGEMVGQWVVGT